MLIGYKRINYIIFSIFFVCLFFLSNTQALAITWCHDYTLYEVTKSDHNRTRPDKLHRVLRENGYQVEFTVPPVSSELSQDLRCGDIIVIGGAHSGVVDKGLKIDHYLQPIIIGGTVDKIPAYKPNQIKPLKNFKNDWSIRDIRQYSRINRQPEVIFGVFTGRYSEWEQFPYKNMEIAIWRRQLVDQEKLLKQANQQVEKCRLDIETLINPILTNKVKNLDICPQIDLSAEAKALLDKANDIEKQLEAAKDIVKGGAEAHKKASSAATSAGESKDKIEAANKSAGDIASTLKDKLPTRSSAESLCTESIALVEEINKNILLATKYEADIAPFYEGTEGAKEKVCGEIRAIAESLPEGANETIVIEATNIANRANQNAQYARTAAEKSKENADLAIAGLNNLETKLNKKGEILKSVAEFKQDFNDLPLLSDAEQHLADAESELINADIASSDALDIEGQILNSSYVKACYMHTNSADLISEAHGEANAAGDEQDKTRISVEMARQSLASITEKLNNIKGLETLAKDIETILNSCTIPDINPIDGAKAAADRAGAISSQAHDNWTEAEKCASHIREPRVVDGEEDGEASEEEPTGELPPIVAETEKVPDEPEEEPTGELPPIVAESETVPDEPEPTPVPMPVITPSPRPTPIVALRPAPSPRPIPIPTLRPIITPRPRPTPTQGRRATPAPTYDLDAELEDCFIATAVYGNPNVSQITTFRKFRDTYLLSSKEGRELTQMYYIYGPSLAGEVKQHPGVVLVLRGVLNGFADWLEENPDSDPMTKVLINKVISATNTAAIFVVDSLDDGLHDKYEDNADLSNDN